MREWSKEDRAAWVLQHGPTEPVIWIYERNGDMVYRRPHTAPNKQLPPWINTERELLSVKGSRMASTDDLSDAMMEIFDTLPGEFQLMTGDTDD